MKTRQLQLLKKPNLAYGGELQKKRKGRAGARPLSVRSSMHLVLRSSLARGPWSFRQSKNARLIAEIIKKFSEKYRLDLLSVANVGNHLHLHIRLKHRGTYRPFIRAVTAAIAMAVTGASRWKTKKQLGIKKFWDYRPFTRVVQGFRAYLNMRDYVQINQMEGSGIPRSFAKILVKNTG